MTDEQELREEELRYLLQIVGRVQCDLQKVVAHWSDPILKDALTQLGAYASGLELVLREVLQKTPNEAWTVTNSDGIAIGKVTKVSVGDGGVAVGEPVVRNVIGPDGDVIGRMKQIYLKLEQDE